MRPTRSSALNVRRLAVAGCLALAVWLSAPAPAMAQRLSVAGSECDNVPFCQTQPQPTPTFGLGGWASADIDFTCKGDYPYVWSFSYSQTGSPSVSAIGAILETSPQTIGILFTNWNPFQTDMVSVVLGCSKNNSFGGDCGAPVDDPGCPVIAGSEKNYCSRGPVPVCFQSYQERCQPSNQLYQCNILFLNTYCQACPG